MSNKKNGAKSWKNPHFVDHPGANQVAQALQLGKKLREKTAAGHALGTFLIDLPTISTLHAIALAGFDFVVLDMEHSAIDFSNLESLITAGQAAGLTVLVRIWGEDIGLIGKALDLGAHGIMAPHVDSPERARAIVEEARYAPQGSRGFSPILKYASLEEPLRELNESTYIIVQIEGRAAIERIEEITAVEGINAAFVGPYDLALSLGVQPNTPEVFTAAENMASKVPETLDMGIYIDDPNTCGDWVKRRFALQCVSFDGRMLADAARSVAVKARDSVNS